MSIYEDPDAPEALFLPETGLQYGCLHFARLVRREEIEALVRAIGDLPDPLTRRILLKIVELSA
jgi:hypothetical protein